MADNKNTPELKALVKFDSDKETNVKFAQSTKDLFESIVSLGKQKFKELNAEITKGWKETLEKAKRTGKQYFTDLQKSIDKTKELNRKATQSMAESWTKAFNKTKEGWDKQKELARKTTLSMSESWKKGWNDRIAYQKKKEQESLANTKKIGDKARSIWSTNAAHYKRLEKEKTSSDIKSNKSRASRVAETIGYYASIGTAIYGVINFIKQMGLELLELERTMAKIRAITGSTTEAINSLNSVILGISGSFNISTEELGKFAVSMSKLGLSSKEIGDIANTAVGLSKILGEDLSSSGTLIVTTLKAFNLEMSEADRVANGFFDAVKNSPLDIKSLTTSMQYVASAANATNIEFEESIKMLELLANRGIRSSIIGTGLRNVFSTLSESGQDVKQTLEEMSEAGISFSDAVDIFGKRGAIVAYNLITNFDELKDMFEEEMPTALETFVSGIIATGNKMDWFGRQVQSMKANLTNDVSAKTTIYQNTMIRSFVEFLEDSDQEIDESLKLLSDYAKKADELNIEFGFVVEKSNNKTRYIAKNYDSDIVNDLFDKLNVTSNSVKEGIYNLLVKEQENIRQAKILKEARSEAFDVIEEYMGIPSNSMIFNYEEGDYASIFDIVIDDEKTANEKIEILSKAVTDTKKSIEKYEKAIEGKDDSMAIVLDNEWTNVSAVKDKILELNILKKELNQAMNTLGSRDNMSDQEAINWVNSNLDAEGNLSDALIRSIKSKSKSITHFTKLKEIEEKKGKLLLEYLCLTGQIKGSRCDKNKNKNKNLSSDLGGLSMGKPEDFSADFDNVDFTRQLQEAILRIQSGGDITEISNGIADFYNKTIEAATSEYENALIKIDAERQRINDDFSATEYDLQNLISTAPNEATRNDYVKQMESASKEYASVLAILDKQELDSTENYNKLKEKAYKKYIDSIIKIKEEKNRKDKKDDKDELKAEKEKWDAIIDIAQKAISALSNIYSSFAQENLNNRLEAIASELEASQARNEVENDILQSQFDNGIITAEAYAKKREELEKKRIEEENRLNKAAFEAQKKSDINSAIADGTAMVAQAVLSTLAQAKGGVISKGAQAAIMGGIAGIQAAAQVSAIRKRQFYPVKYAEGGEVVGASHANGGVPFTVQGQGGYEMEGGEFIVNKDATAKYKPLLEAINGKNKMYSDTKFFADGGMVQDVRIKDSQMNQQLIRAYITKRDLRDYEKGEEKIKNISRL